MQLAYRTASNTPILYFYERSTDGTTCQSQDAQYNSAHSGEDAGGDRHSVH
jgi:hypothetical protein